MSDFLHYEALGGGRVSAIETAPDGSTILRVQAAEGVWWDVRVKADESKENVAQRVDASIAKLNAGGEPALAYFREQQRSVLDRGVWLPAESHEKWAARVRGDMPTAKEPSALVEDPRCHERLVE